MSKLSNKKFISLTEKRKHKHAARLLGEILNNSDESILEYREYENILSLPAVKEDQKSLLDRIYLHEQKALIPFPDQFKVLKEDKISTTPPLTIDIYLENLRSMHNIGAILRTAEAFRLGTVYISKELPLSALEKIQKTAMGADKTLTIKVAEDITKLKKPIIAIETCEDAEDCNTFDFPESFTLLFGNEAYGLSDKALRLASHTIHIPLYGNKNSLNVSSAFAILANCICNKKYCRK